MFLYLAAILFLFYIWIKSIFTYWEKLGFPYVPGKFPLGSTTNVGRTEHMSTFLTREYNNFKHKTPAFGIYHMLRPTLVLTDPELIKEILVKSFDNFHSHGIAINEKADPLNGNLFFKSGQEWKDLRAKLSPTFTSGRMKMMFPLVSTIADDMIEYLKDIVEKSDTHEMKEIYSSFTTEVIASVAFGLDTKCHGNPNNDFRRMARSIFEPTAMENIKNLIIISSERISKLFNMSFNRQETTDFFLRIVRENLEYREKNNVKRNDFFQLLINIKNSEIGMTFNEIAANSFVFFAAGFETSSSVMTFSTYELALNQDIQDRLRSEIHEVLEKYNGEVSYDAIKEMKYLDMVFKETLRRYPALDNQNRKSTHDFKIPNSKLIIPAGTNIIIPVHGLHNDERFYENPEKFDPERFSEENIKKRPSFVYIPFSEGGRMCIGYRFGTMESKVGLIKLLSVFRILPSEKTSIPIQFSPTASLQTPLGGMWLKLQRL
uniref:Cytochrome P450 n=1 Tax=Chironomus tentans TaxID=7153 RepID=A0A1W6R7I5_CHITE|nr:cytochrome P450 [Chironomus tentans]